MSQHRNQSPAELAHEMEYILRTTRIDRAAFIALDAETKAARWRQFSAGAKADLIEQCLIAGNFEADAESITAFIAKYDAKYGDAPLSTEAAVTGALERLAEDAASNARTARQAGNTREAGYFQREANAYGKALEAYLDGTRPTPLSGGRWLLPSRTGGITHLLVKDGGWVCTCAAGGQAHWASALLVGIEVAADDMRGDGYGAETAPVELAAARRELVARIDRAAAAAWRAA